jgi:hypothetical protein
MTAIGKCSKRNQQKNQRQAKRKLAKYEMKMKRRRICAAGGEIEGGYQPAGGVAASIGWRRHRQRGGRQLCS